jgi:hypothetical protein
MNPDFILSPERLKAIVEKSNAKAREKASPEPPKASAAPPPTEETTEEPEGLSEAPAASEEEQPETVFRDAKGGDLLDEPAE